MKIARRFKLVTAILFSGLVILATKPPVAQAAETPESIIKARKAAMKEVVLKGLKASNQMIKDDFFDGDEAAEHMSKIAEVADGFAKRFPKGTESGFETTVKPEVWSKRADFEARLKKFAGDAKTAAAAAKKGFDEFKTAFKTLAKNCKGCHETYRIKKK